MPVGVPCGTCLQCVSVSLNELSVCDVGVSVCMCIYVCVYLSKCEMYDCVSVYVFM